MEHYGQTMSTLFTLYAWKIVASILIFIVGRWLARQIANLFSRLLGRNQVDPTLVKFLTNIAYYALLTGVIIAAISQLGINTTSFLTVVGAAGLAIGLALKDSLSNFSSGVMLILFRPFKIGDAVTAAGVTGAVKEISIFSTELATPDNQKIIIPNSAIMGGVITNITANDTRRIDLVVGISYSDNIGKAKEVLESILATESRILETPAPTIAVSELGASSVDLVVRPWVKTEEYWAVRFNLTEKIKTEFDAEGLSFPFPQQDVHLFTENTEQAS